MITQFTDAATIAGTRRTEDGYLIADVLCARTGIQTYTGAEVGLADRDVVRVWRPEASVFDKASLATFAHKPVTIGHPDRVTADNWKDHAVGDLGDEIVRDGDGVRVPLKLMDASAIKLVEDGVREVSMGYRCNLEFTDGVTPEGEQYDAVQHDIKINHLAIVPRGRAGSEFRIGDDAGKWGAAPITTMSDKKETKMSDALKPVVLGDKVAHVAIADAQLIEQFKIDTAKAAADAMIAHETAIAAKDAEIATKDAKIDKLEKSVLTDTDLDARVAARAKLIGDAKTIDKDVKVDGLSDADIRKAVVAAKLGDEVIKDRSDAYIEARFDALVEDAGDTFADTMKEGTKRQSDMSASDEAYAENVTHLETAWQTQTQKKEA